MQETTTTQLKRIVELRDLKPLFDALGINTKGLRTCIITASIDCPVTVSVEYLLTAVNDDLGVAVKRFQIEQYDYRLLK